MLIFPPTFRSPKICRQCLAILPSSRRTLKLRQKKSWSDTETLPAAASRRKQITVVRPSRSRIPAAMRMHPPPHVSKQTHLRMPRGRCRARSATFKAQWPEIPPIPAMRPRTMGLHHPTFIASAASATVANRIPFNLRDSLNKCLTELARVPGPWGLPVDWLTLAPKFVSSDMHYSKIFAQLWLVFSCWWYLAFVLRLGLNATGVKFGFYFQAFCSIFHRWVDGVGFLPSHWYEFRELFSQWPTYPGYYFDGWTTSCLLSFLLSLASSTIWKV